MAEYYRYPLVGPYGPAIDRSLLLDVTTTWAAIVDDETYEAGAVDVVGAITIPDVTSSSALLVTDYATAGIAIPDVVLASTLTITTPGSGGGGADGARGFRRSNVAFLVRRLRRRRG